MSRAILATAVKIVVPWLLTAPLPGLMILAFGNSATHPLTLIFAEGPIIMVALLWPGMLAWTVFCIVGHVRRRGMAWGVGWSILAAFLTLLFATMASSFNPLNTDERSVALVFGVVLLGGSWWFLMAVVTSLIAHLVVRTPVGAVVPS
jgi:hypothetical protein